MAACWRAASGSCTATGNLDIAQDFGASIAALDRNFLDVLRSVNSSFAPVADVFNPAGKLIVDLFSYWPRSCEIDDDRMVRTIGLAATPVAPRANMATARQGEEPKRNVGQSCAAAVQRG